ncbi:hydrogen gas-evolving membrane-bound hydrogenase subunit E [Nocardiopsis gilva]|uniref:hydrogen gas-evolving membrane-bound hydrogenase subunit E n=1 Tax=Nocardiopsis gilva TaxID=280236 RepID=UPI001E4874FE|nr:hydrogen gas-evolving membrane-bound hydrogenase subunit E [Nocardiopsis gilva]
MGDDGGAHRRAHLAGYARHAAEAGGDNLVNLILADFRALDTFGEIVVLATAAIAVASLVLLNRRARVVVEEPEEENGEDAPAAGRTQWPRRPRTRRIGVRRVGERRIGRWGNERRDAMTEDTRRVRGAPPRAGKRPRALAQHSHPPGVRPRSVLLEVVARLLIPRS